MLSHVSNMFAHRLWQECAKVERFLYQRDVTDGMLSPSKLPLDHDALWLALFNKVWQRGAHAPYRSLIDCNGYIESKRSSMRIHSTLRQGEEWEIRACLSFFFM